MIFKKPLSNRRRNVTQRSEGGCRRNQGDDLMYNCISKYVKSKAFKYMRDITFKAYIFACLSVH